MNANILRARCYWIRVDIKVDTYFWPYKGIGNLGVQRAWSKIMNVLANPKGSVGRWNMNFWRLEQFYTIFWSNKNDGEATSSTHLTESEDKLSPREDWRMIKLELLFFLSKMPFLGHILLNKNRHIHFLVHGHSSWSTYGVHLVRGPRLQNQFVKKSDHGSWTMNSNHWKRSSSMVWLRGP